MRQVEPNKLITVFGGSGFIGRYVVQLLAQKGYRVRVAVRRPNEAIALAEWNWLLENGLYVNLAVPPGTPQSSSLLRISSKNQKGGALFYVLLSIALLAAITMSFSRIDNQNISSTLTGKLAQELSTQLQTVQSAVMDCVLRYPEGGGDLDTDGDVDSDDNAGCNVAGRILQNRSKWPRKPNSAQRSGCSVGGKLAHLGPPTEPNKIASLASQPAMVESGKALP